MTIPTPTAPPASTPEPITPDPARVKRDASTEAAARRHELREEQAGRAADAVAASEREAALMAQITGYRRSSIETYLAGTTDVRGDGSNAPSLQRAADLWDILAGTPDQFYDAVGALDAEALADFITAGTTGRDYLTRAFVEGVPPYNAVAEALARQQIPNARTAPVAATWQSALHGTAQ